MAENRAVGHEDNEPFEWRGPFISRSLSSLIGPLIDELSPIPVTEMMDAPVARRGKRTTRARNARISIGRRCGGRRGARVSSVFRREGRRGMARNRASFSLAPSVTESSPRYFVFPNRNPERLAARHPRRPTRRSAAQCLLLFFSSSLFASSTSAPALLSLLFLHPS